MEKKNFFNFYSSNQYLLDVFGFEPKFGSYQDAKLPIYRRVK